MYVHFKTGTSCLNYLLDPTLTDDDFDIRHPVVQLFSKDSQSVNNILLKYFNLTDNLRDITHIKCEDVKVFKIFMRNVLLILKHIKKETSSDTLYFMHSSVFPFFNSQATESFISKFNLEVLLILYMVHDQISLQEKLDLLKLLKEVFINLKNISDKSDLVYSTISNEVVNYKVTELTDKDVDDLIFDFLLECSIILLKILATSSTQPLHDFLNSEAVKQLDTIFKLPAPIILDNLGVNLAKPSSYLIYYLLTTNFTNLKFINDGSIKKAKVVFDDGAIITPTLLLDSSNTLQKSLLKKLLIDHSKKFLLLLLNDALVKNYIQSLSEHQFMISMPTLIEYAIHTSIDDIMLALLNIYSHKKRHDIFIANKMILTLLNFYNSSWYLYHKDFLKAYERLINAPRIFKFLTHNELITLIANLDLEPLFTEKYTDFYFSTKYATKEEKNKWVLKIDKIFQKSLLYKILCDNVSKHKSYVFLLSVLSPSLSYSYFLLIKNGVVPFMSKQLVKLFIDQSHLLIYNVDLIMQFYLKVFKYYFNYNEFSDVWIKILDKLLYHIKNFNLLSKSNAGSLIFLISKLQFHFNSYNIYLQFKNKLHKHVLFLLNIIKYITDTTDEIPITNFYAILSVCSIIDLPITYVSKFFTNNFLKKINVPSKLFSDNFNIYDPINKELIECFNYLRPKYFKYFMGLLEKLIPEKNKLKNVKLQSYSTAFRLLCATVTIDEATTAPYVLFSIMPKDIKNNKQFKTYMSEIFTKSLSPNYFYSTTSTITKFRNYLQLLIHFLTIINPNYNFAKHKKDLYFLVDSGLRNDEIKKHEDIFNLLIVIKNLLLSIPETKKGLIEQFFDAKMEVTTDDNTGS